MIRAQELTKFYERRRAVNGLSFQIMDREIVGFLGPNGAGKTTVLRMLAGLLSPSSGRIEIDGADLLDNPLALRWRIGFLPERPPLYDDMRVSAYLSFAARLRGVDQDVPRKVQDAIGRTGLGEYTDEPIQNLSHGFRQRLGIAQAIIHDPALVILDEPINGLDPRQIVEMRELIRSLKERHTVLISSHILTEISQTCDRLLIIDSGTLQADGSEAELSSKFGAASNLELTLLGARESIERTLGQVGVVKSFRITDDTNGVIEVVAEMTRNAPEEVSQALFSVGIGVRRLQPSHSELESLFLRLTGGGRPS